MGACSAPAAHRLVCVCVVGEVSHLLGLWQAASSVECMAQLQKGFSQRSVEGPREGGGWKSGR